jgi:serine/threonine-protein kinase RsbW
VHLRIHSQTEKLNLVREFIGEAAREYGFGDEAIGKIMLAVDEACTNIIKHAYGYAPDGTIDLEIQTNGDRFDVIITHAGKSFDPAVVKKPDMQEYFKKYQRGGLGIHLMRTLMDGVEYEALPDRRNIVRLFKYLPHEAKSRH